MTLFDHRRLTNAVLKLDIDGLRRGIYSDKYFENIVGVMQGARAASYTYSGLHPRALPLIYTVWTLAISKSKRRFLPGARRMRWSPGWMRRW